MNRTLYTIFFCISLCFLFLILTSMWHRGKPISQNQLAFLEPVTSNHSPFKTFIFGVGTVEGKGGNINIGAPVNRVVEKVPVTAGAKVKKGTNLVMFESSDLQAEVMVQELAYQEAQASLKKMKALPRPEDLIAAEADFKNAVIMCYH